MAYENSNLNSETRINFYRGSLAKYNEGIVNGKYENDIYFVTDGQRTIMAQGKVYGLTEAEQKLLNSLGTALVSVDLVGSDTLKFVDNNGEETNVILPAVTDTASGLMTAIEHIKLAGIEEGAEVNIIENIAVTSDPIKVTGYLYDGTEAGTGEFEIPAVEVDPASTTNNRTTTINLQSTLEQFAYKGAVYTKKEVEERIKANVTAAYKVMGSKTNEELLALDVTELEVGEVYNMSTAGSVPTVGGEGSADTTGDNTFPAGTNFVVVEYGDSKGWDALAGNFDTSVLEQRLDNDEALIEANTKAIEAEVTRATNAEAGLGERIDYVEDELIGVAGQTPIGDIPSNAAEQTIHERIDLLYDMIGSLDMGNANSWAEFILTITDAKYVDNAGEGKPADGVTPTLATIDSQKIDTFVDVASLIKELIAADRATDEALATETDERKQAIEDVIAAYKAADEVLKGDLEDQLAAAKAAIDAYKVNDKLISSNPVLNGGDIKLTGYAANTSEAQQTIVEGNTVNDAIAKLERNLDLAAQGQSDGLKVERERIDAIEDILETNSTIEGQTDKGLIQVVSNLVSGDNSVATQIENAIDEVKGEGWDSLTITDANGTTHANTLVGLKEYIDAQDTYFNNESHTYTDTEISNALAWYDAD